MKHQLVPIREEPSHLLIFPIFNTLCVCMFLVFISDLRLVSARCWDLYHIFLRFLAWPYFKMGKNQAYKAMQKARLGSSSSTGPVEIEDGMVCTLSHYYPWVVSFPEMFIIEMPLSCDVRFLF